MGCPGSGKGTQTARILQKYPNIKTISSGDALRHHVNQKTHLGLRVESLLASGKLVPSEIITPMMFSMLDNEPGEWLLDGFPRTLDQAQKLDEYLESNDENINFVINLNVPWSVILKRIEVFGFNS